MEPDPIIHPLPSTIPMRLAVWPVPPAQALADVLASAGPVTEVVPVEPYEARAAPEEGRADLVLVPTLDALRDLDGLELVPGVGLVGTAGPTRALVVGSALDAVRTIGFDPRYGQDALLAQILLKEHYGGTPAFRPADPAAALDTLLAENDAVLAAPDVDAGGRLVLDLGQEWVELTLRPMVWGLVVAQAGALAAEAARLLRDAARAAAPPEAALLGGDRAYQLTLDGYAMDGLDEFANHLYYHGALPALPDLPFVVIPPDEEEE